MSAIVGIDPGREAGEPTAIRIVVDGAPVGKGRPRHLRRKGKGGAVYTAAITPKKTVNYETLLAALSGEVMQGRPPLDGPLSVTITAFMPIAVSWSKKKTAAALDGSFRPGLPDADNIAKCVGDGLNGIVWRDDRQIAELRISKLYDVDPRLEIEVRPIQAARARWSGK